ncbi:MAG: hypothetical protein AAF280_09450 [Pseudomonadota bacterium]
MPHAELFYSSDLSLDPMAVLERIEEVLVAHDPGSGACKGRAYPAEIFRHTHFIARVSMLPKPHRDAAFIASLSAELEAAIKLLIPEPCAFTLDVSFSSINYITNLHEGSG